MKYSLDFQSVFSHGHLPHALEARAGLLDRGDVVPAEGGEVLAEDGELVALPLRIAAGPASEPMSSIVSALITGYV
jgi:hypothetical protein